jgi:hypothetical protein
MVAGFTTTYATSAHSTNRSLLLNLPGERNIFPVEHLQLTCLKYRNMCYENIYICTEEEEVYGV